LTSLAPQLDFCANTVLNCTKNHDKWNRHKPKKNRHDSVDIEFHIGVTRQRKESAKGPEIEMRETSARLPSACLLPGRALASQSLAGGNLM
jgi:hypothetical protein